MMAWAYAVAGHRSPVLYDGLANTARVRGVRDFKTQAIANTAWSFAYAGVDQVHDRGEELFAMLAEVAAGQVHDFQPKSLTKVVWAYAMAGHRSPHAAQLFASLAEVATKQAAQRQLAADELVRVRVRFRVRVRVRVTRTLTPNLT